MLPSSFWSEKSSRSQGYESVNTDSTDGDHNRHDEIFPPEQNKTHSFDSDKEYNDEEQIKYRNHQNRSAWSLRALIFVCGNVVLFLISLSLFIARGNRWSTQPNKLYRQFTTYCKYTKIQPSNKPSKIFWA